MDNVGKTETKKIVSKTHWARREWGREGGAVETTGVFRARVSLHWLGSLEKDLSQVDRGQRIKGY